MSRSIIDAAIEGLKAPPAHQIVPQWATPITNKPKAALSQQQQRANQIAAEASVLARFRQWPQAAQALLQACELWPINADLQYHAGCCLLEAGRPDLAVQRFDRALGLRPTWSDAWNNKSAALARMGNSDGALAAAHKAIEHGENVAALANLCAAYSAQGDNQKALEYGERSIQLSQGTNAMALVNYGVALRAVWELEAAAGAQQRAIELTQKQPSGAADHMAWSNLGAIRNLQGRNQEAYDLTQRACELNPTSSTIRSNMVMFADLLPETTLVEALCMRRTWAHLFEAPKRRLWRRHQNDLDPNRRLKVGYVGADFRQHSAAHLHGPVIRAHDPDRIAVYVYAGNRGGDAITAKFREAPALAEWVDTSATSDEGLAERIYADRIDILVDVAGFTSGGRLPTFALKPAPIQVCAWGYANGTGLDAMDVFFADNVLVPPHLEHGYRETVVRLPCLLTFDPFVDLPEPGPPPREANGYVTFGSYNRVEKISPQILRLWCEVMKRTPDSQIVLKFGGLQGETAEHLKQGFEYWGVSRDRVECRGHTPREEHIRQYADIDIMLDSWPHSGGVTTLEAALMGVPSITLLGDRAPSRVAGAILTAIGAEDWVAETPERYLEIAAEKTAADLSALRMALPGMVRGSVVGDPVAYTRHVDAAYRSLWQAYVSRVAPAEESAA